jgi:cell division protein FtsB
MPGQPRRGSGRPTPGVGIRGPGQRPRTPVRATSVRGTEPAAPRPVRIGAPKPVAGPRARTQARPGTARRSAPVAAPRVRTGQPNRFTGRATVLALVLGALLLAYAYPVRIYLNQQSEIAALREHQRAQQEHIAGLQAESAKWNDPAYVESQACSRLYMCRPGDTLYIVVGGHAAGASPGAVPAATDRTWYDKLWSSVTSADHPGQQK